jgi:hypothetical protein
MTVEIAGQLSRDEGHGMGGLEWPVHDRIFSDTKSSMALLRNMTRLGCGSPETNAEGADPANEAYSSRMVPL